MHANVDHKLGLRLAGSKQQKFPVGQKRPLDLSGPVLRDTARLPRDYLSNTPLLRGLGFLVSQHCQLGAIRPPPFLSASPLESMRSGGAIPPLKRGISAILARYPMKTRQMGAIPPSAILSRKGIARYGGVSRTGPLSAHLRCGICWT